MTTQTPPDLEPRVSNLGGQVSQIDARLNDMNSNIAGFRTEMNSFRSDVNTRLASLDAKIDSLRNIIIIASAGMIGTLIAGIIALIIAG